MDNAGLSLEETERLNEKFDIMLQELKDWGKRFEEKFLKVDKKLDMFNIVNQEEHKKLFENIDCIYITLAKLNTSNQEEHKKLLENIDCIDRRITVLKSDNEEDHIRISKDLDSINSAFIRYETDGIDKIKILFDSDVDRKNHQDIYGHEFKRLNDLVAKNSFRISNLEQHFNQN